ncbi:ferric iron reductase protein FhuF [Geomicrobium halophilum]|uniref:Ferric iron reductase protein FhuF n=1 Tax=Geomicrobium halophilum TaxID=549000 RepID=A0A841PQL9_9BACL|nr:IucA/IucC family C-terminal-domain containing protein [Geomicrobium halophilum]MBB6451080.1 ferric iron reductase protein FhuF [Geomicrobium halophilum]
MNIEQLESFGVKRKNQHTSGIPIVDLLTEEVCHSFLQQYMEDIKAPNKKVAASLFMKQYARFTVASTLYSMGAYNCALSLPMQACMFSSERKLCVQEEACPFKQWEQWDREAWRENLLRELFSYHITPMVSVFKDTTRVSSNILWENVAVRVNSVYRKALANEPSPEKQWQLTSDFYYLKQADGSLFQWERNPIRSYLKIDPDSTNTHYRQTCCLYHRLEEDPEGIGYCNNCPIGKKSGKR